MAPPGTPATPHPAGLQAPTGEGSGRRGSGCVCGIKGAGVAEAQLSGEQGREQGPLVTETDPRKEWSAVSAGSWQAGLEAG